MKEEVRNKIIRLAKQYSHIDYNDDDEIIEIMVDASIQGLKEKIANFDDNNITQRQKLLIFVTVKQLYDNREKYEDGGKGLQTAVSSMLLEEMYKL